ncbi:MAG: TIGR00366 family protein [Flavobacteriales bacterium]|jgi:short-chain fatty acids transporter|nr:TIGR00366 family protein [Flavobacteriales bacterium]
MPFSQKIEKAFRTFLPSPFSIAVILTFLVFVLAVFFGNTPSDESATIFVVKAWKNGLFQAGFMRFLVQMMLMLVLGHVIALSPPVSKFIDKGLNMIKTGGQAIVWMAIVSILVGLFNWGLGLIVSAILARKMGEYASQKKIALHYPLLVATAYVSLMVWHGGISGSAPAKAAENGHLSSLMTGILSSDQLQELPQTVSYGQTIFSGMNLLTMALLLLIIPLSVYLLHKKIPKKIPQLRADISDIESSQKHYGAEKLDHFYWIPKIIGFLFILPWIYHSFWQNEEFLASIHPDSINLLLFGLAIFSHKSINQFIRTTQTAIQGGTGILIQFPLYFGIMGMMKDSGLVHLMSDFFVSISSTESFPIFTFISAGLVNIFVPSGGGQWGVQGPIIIQAAQSLDISYAKSIMALAYGDQITNMLQPFWALPLLGICKLKASDILPYTLFLFLIGSVIFLSVLWIF